MCVSPSLCVELWTRECRCLCGSEASDLPGTAVAGNCKSPNMYAGNKTQVQVLIHLSSSSALFIETKLPHCTWTWEFSLADLLARPQNPHTLLLSAGGDLGLEGLHDYLTLCSLSPLPRLLGRTFENCFFKPQRYT